MINDYNQSYTFKAPPKANWKIKFGDSTDTYFQFYIKSPPNRFQRWMIGKIFGIRWEAIE